MDQEALHEVRMLLIMIMIILLRSDQSVQYMLILPNLIVAALDADIARNV